MERIVIVAVSQNGVIGVDNGIPWKHKADMKRFRELTTGNIVIMGRKTYESIGRPLPNRRNIVVSRTKVEQEGIETYSSLESALEAAEQPMFDCTGTHNHEDEVDTRKIYFIGGKGIYEEAMKFAHKLDVTLVPETITAESPVVFPWVNPAVFKVEDIVRDDINNLIHVNYVRL